MIYVQFALSVQKCHNKYTVAPKEACRPQNFILNFGQFICVHLKKILKEKNLKDFFNRMIQRLKYNLERHFGDKYKI